LARRNCAALSHARDQVAALRRVTEIDDAHLQVIHRGIQGEAEQQQLERRRHDQRDRQALVPADLIELFFDKRDEPVIHMLSCILRIFFHASR
jgi:hypothetical protein